ncbi:hypothetical protein ACQKJ1_28120 [Methylorubrum rhodesianum]|uniref:hypothetical protein n=1 Tax=Methylorubrum rhodesianum TaxID=29427 RepID=UPI003CFDD074
MASSKAKQLSQKEAKETLSNLLAAFEQLEVSVPGLTYDGFKTLLTIALSSWTENRSRLPDVTKVAKDLEKSLSSGSRLVGLISDPGNLSLVEARSGLSGSRSDALVLTPRGNTILSDFVETLTGREIGHLAVQNFDSFLEQKTYNTHNEQAGDSIYLKLISYDKTDLSMHVAPKDDALSETISDWCRSNLSAMPAISSAKDDALFKFSKVSDAVYFRLHWCWR